MLKIITKKQTQLPILKIAYDAGKVLIQDTDGAFYRWFTIMEEDLQVCPLVVGERCFMIDYQHPKVLCALYAVGAMPVVTEATCYDVMTGETLWQKTLPVGENKTTLESLKINTDKSYGNEGLLESYIAEAGSREWQALVGCVPKDHQSQVRLDMEMAETEGKALLIYYLSAPSEGGHALHMAWLDEEGECRATLALSEGLKGAAPGNAVITEDKILIQTAINELCLIEW